MTLQPQSVHEVQQAVREQPMLRPRGAGTKPALSAGADGIVAVHLSALSGILEYEPAECTFTALAGTPLRQIEEMLAVHGQYLPFDPPFVRAGATLAGTVAAGLSGPGRYRYGGVRDFLLGARFVDGEGRLVRSGGKVVKNAAGFYLHNLLVGSLGRLGALVDITCKVFPRPEARATVSVRYSTFAAALAALRQIAGAPFDLEALDLEPPGTLWIRLGGFGEALPARTAALEQSVGAAVEVLYGDEEAAVWERQREFTWREPDCSLIKVPLTPAHIPALDEALETYGASRRYSVGGNVAWVAGRDTSDGLDAILRGLGLSGLMLVGQAGTPLLGSRPADAFVARAKQALDPAGRFGPLPG
jgi:glycolate oxidase FAD binding subunit